MRIKISEEVKNAIANGLPVVALESTIISHGMPYPKNVQTAYEVEETVRKNGAIPATIGIIDGVPVVGMSKEEIEEFGKWYSYDMRYKHLQRYIVTIFLFTLIIYYINWYNNYEQYTF